MNLVLSRRLAIKGMNFLVGNLGAPLKREQEVSRGVGRNFDSDRAAGIVYKVRGSEESKVGGRDVRRKRKKQGEEKRIL